METKRWAEAQMNGAGLGDARRERRAKLLLAGLAAHSGGTLPEVCGGNHSALIAAYRFFGHEKTSPASLQSAHRRSCAEQLRQMPVALCAQGTTELDFSERCVSDLGAIGNGRGQGLVQHSALALSVDGAVLGVLRQECHANTKPPAGGTLRERQQREEEGNLWADTVASLEDLDLGDCRLIHVGDCGSDNHRFLGECARLGHGLVIRIGYDPRARDDKRLWTHLESQPVAATYRLKLPASSQRKARLAVLEVRFAPMIVIAPASDPRRKGAAPLPLWAVLVREAHPPRGEEPVEWMLLTDEVVTSMTAARRVIGYYEQHWKLGEWHRALKEGCRMERSQLKRASALSRLAALLGMVAVRLLQQRDKPQDNSAPELPPV